MHPGFKPWLLTLIKKRDVHLRLPLPSYLAPDPNPENKPFKSPVFLYAAYYSSLILQFPPFCKDAPGVGEIWFFSGTPADPEPLILS